TLDEIPNDITKETPACFEPTIDYCVVKIPRFTFEKFSSSNPTLTVSMKSVGEAMSIGRTFKEALQKGLRSLEIKKYGLESLTFKDLSEIKVNHHMLEKIHHKLVSPDAERIFYIADAFRAGDDIDKIHALTKIDRWFLQNIKEITEMESEIIKNKDSLSPKQLLCAKQYGFSDRQLAALLGRKEEDIYKLRKSLKIEPAFKLVDTCAAEFQAHTPYFYSTYDK
ncbi:MAG: carbamoyl phosphate synthase large subunit, partial [Candidatus Omnitrophica bacterium]|nr:carbamoyl phosphate synthase large subunit [Candidatus Omnitrophota bacterium]